MSETGIRSEELSFDTDDLPTDVFELTSKGLTVESLTDGHGFYSCCAGPPSSQCSSA